MKKVRSMLIAVLTLLLAFSLFACGGKDDGKKGADGAPDPSDVKGEQVTAEEWAKAFDYSNVTNVVAKAWEEYAFEGQIEKWVEITEYDGDKKHIAFTRTDGAETETSECYEAKEGGKYYGYTKNETSEKWSREEIGIYEHWGVQALILEFTDDANETFDKFTYDNDAKAYICVFTDEYDEYTMSIKIAQGKLAEATITGTKGEEKAFMGLQLYDIGKASVTLPTVSAGDDNENGNDDADVGEANELGQYVLEQSVEGTPMTMIITLKANNIVLLSAEVEGEEVLAQQGTYEIIGNRLILTFTDEGKEHIAEGTIQTGVSIVLVEEGEEMTFTKRV